MDPITALLIVGTAVSAIGAVQQGRAAKAQGQFQAALIEQQADVTEQQAESERVAARQSEGDFRRQQSALMARRRAILGASGVDQSTGSALLVSQDFARETELQALRIRSGGEIRGTRLEQQADLQRGEAGFARLAGSNAQTAGFLRAGSTLLTGFGTTFGRK